MAWTKLFKGLALTIGAGLLAGTAWLAIAPPELLRVGAAYSAKIVCSSVFVSGRTAEEVLADDVQAPGHPLLKLVGVAVDREGRSVTARLAGFIAPQVAIYRQGYGCTLAPEGRAGLAPVPDAPRRPSRQDPAALWPDGPVGMTTPAALATVLADPTLSGPGMRALVVIKNGRLIGETYGAGFTRETPLLGWSMTKTVTGAMLGALEGEGMLSVEEAGLLPGWTDERRTIRFADLMAMESGLDFNEAYGDVSDVTRMLFLEPDMAAFTASRPAIAPPGTVFNYSSGNSVLLSRLWMDRFSDRPAAYRAPRRLLFDPLGMESAVMEVDAAGTFVGSSYMYATAQDWARFGQLLADKGRSKGRQLVPEATVAAMMTPTAASKGVYSRNQTWITAPKDILDAVDLPKDLFTLQGHDGQVVAVIPSEGLVIVRLGLTPSKLGYRPQPLFRAVIDATR